VNGGTLGGATVAVIGAGVAGLLTLLAAAHLGAGRRVAVARHPHQAAAARRLGADAVVPADLGTALDGLRAERPDVVVEAVGGAAETFDLAVRAVVPGGEVMVLGLFDAPQTLDARRAVFRELRLSFPVTYGERDGVHDFAVALDALVAGGEAAASLISHRFPLDAVDRAFARAADKGDDVLRVVVTP
jgi:threonine dehydrogenase-like Zn-dependent dehydrogenase